jgi:L,D-peptidoglycan transpeptidase YkuD (ErfK/YbiS/YcfS/YnhG family)
MNDSSHMQVQVKQTKDHLAEVTFADSQYAAAIGKTGVTAVKAEGDHASPIGNYALRAVYYRADKIQKPTTSLPVHIIQKTDGWCDDPAHPLYNRKISTPFDASHETLWRDDDVYDLVVILGHNDNPPMPGKGSCIFMHVARENYEGTEGCVALSLPDLQDLLGRVAPNTQISILKT